MSELKLSPADEPKVRDLLVRVWVRDISADDGWNELETMLAVAPQPPVGDEIAGYLHRVLEEPTFYAADNIHIVDGMPLYLESAVTARDQQITALQARIAELVKALGNIYESADQEYSHGYLKTLADEALNLDALAQQVTKHD